ncbi:ABC transporter substrate-binding protein [Tsukamurella soli]|uniref:ABC transporter substrate-binding protein n=1 Tax=Tsukamurella soli TaxID=644556 RepID=A0ABP8J1G6_9ACTN
MTLPKNLVAAAAGIAAATVVLAGCGSRNPLDSSGASTSASDTVTVGTANFAESEILGYLYADALQDNGIKATVKPGIGARDAYIAALKDGSIDAVPEYTGNLLQYFDAKATAQSSDEVYSALTKAVPSGLTVLDKAAAEDADSLNVTKEFSDTHHVTSLAQLAGLKIPIKVGAPPEFSTRPYGLPGLKSKYGLDATLVPINDGGGPITVKALIDGQVQVADIFSTTPAIKQNGFVTLADPQHMILAQNIVPLLARKKASAKVTAVLDKLQSILTTDDLIAMNTSSTTDKQSAQTIARNWLDKHKVTA